MGNPGTDPTGHRFAASELGRHCVVWKSRILRSGQRQARLPDGVRIYAIGDVHGRSDLLDQVLARVEADLSKYPAARPIRLFLGDYIDRGPDSRAVLDQLIALDRQHEAVFLRGNHETYVAAFLADPLVLDEWQRFGGLETLVSYGIAPSINATADLQAKLAAALERELPGDHRRFLDSLRPSFGCGDFFFVHAGVRPGVPLAQQNEDDMLWIRDDFLLHEADFGKIIVHGHTPVLQPDIRPNRINIDTGAYATGQLTCLVLEGERLLFL